MQPFKLQEKIEDMIDYAEAAVQQYPPLFRNTLGKRMLDKCYEIADLCESANNDFYKKAKIKTLDEANKSLQRMVRRANRTYFCDKKGNRRQLLDLHKYTVWSDKLIELGKIIGGWKQSVASQPPPPSQKR